MLIYSSSLLHLNLLLFIFFCYTLTWDIYSAFLLQLNMELCFSADTPPLSGIHIKHRPPPLHGTLSADYHHTFICDFTAVSHLYLAPFHSITLALLRGGSFLPPPLLVTFFLHLLPYCHTLI